MHDVKQNAVHNVQNEMHDAQKDNHDMETRTVQGVDQTPEIDTEYTHSPPTGIAPPSDIEQGTVLCCVC